MYFSAFEVISSSQYCPVVFLLTRHSGVMNECLYLLVDEMVAMFIFVVRMKEKTVMIRAQMDHRCFTNKRKRKKN